MGVITFSIPKDLVARIAKEQKFDNFVETGTFQGGTCFWAAGHFKNVYTIEIDPAQSKSTASIPDCPRNIEFLVGNSKDLLPKLAPKLSGRSFFWLDGHWCGGGGKDVECPLMQELDAIRNLKDAVIFLSMMPAASSDRCPNPTMPRIGRVSTRSSINCMSCSLLISTLSRTM